MSIDQYTDGKYYENHPTWDLEHAPFKARHVFEMIAKNNLNGRRIADVGCGNGGVLAELKKKLPNSSMFGFDISPQAIEMGKNLHGKTVSLFCENPMAKQDTYDIVLGMDVIEHVEDIFGFLRNVRSLGEYKIFHIPLELNLRWQISANMYTNANKSNGHIHFFNVEIALATLKWAGYEIIDSALTPHAIELAISKKAKIAAIPRRILALFNEQFANKVLGGWSLLVLAK
jgi:SAM-dependent methyltransferase